MSLPRPKTPVLACAFVADFVPEILDRFEQLFGPYQLDSFAITLVTGRPRRDFFDGWLYNEALPAIEQLGLRP